MKTRKPLVRERRRRFFFTGGLDHLERFFKFYVQYSYGGVSKNKGTPKMDGL